MKELSIFKSGILLQAYEKLKAGIPEKK